jgi:hypothetical protein
MSKNQKKKTIYLLDHRLKWRAFKKLHDKIVRDSGPSPKNMDKVLWQMMRDRRIVCWFGKDLPDDMGIGLKIPKGYEVKLITKK